MLHKEIRALIDGIIVNKHRVEPEYVEENQLITVLAAHPEQEPQEIAESLNTLIGERKYSGNHVIDRFIDVRTGPGEEKMGGDRQKRPLLPSCVYYREEKKGVFTPVVGDFAKRQYSTRPQFVSRSIKSQMGQETVTGMSGRAPDRTPADIAAHILKHLLREVKRVYHREITDAIITVPASFDATMCQATLRAAELAGIKTKNAGGSKRQVLLSEPNAVMFDLLNQIQRGEIHQSLLDTRTKKPFSCSILAAVPWTLPSTN